jgi:WD40 repeat protein
LPGQQLCVWSVDYSPDGRSIVSGSADSTVKLWNAETGELVQTLSAQPGDVWKVQFSPDGLPIAAIGMDNTGVYLWSLTGELVGTLIGGQNVVRSLAFSPDSQLSPQLVSMVVGDCGAYRLVKCWAVMLDIPIGFGILPLVQMGD